MSRSTQHTQLTQVEVGYGSTCPHCAEPWQPTLQIEISTRGRGAAAARSTAAIGWGGADAADDAAGGRKATARESLSSPLLSPTLLLQAIATTHPLIPVCVLIIVDECVPEYLAMSGDERALLAQEIEVALQSVHGQHALGRGWRRARTQFPSIFWNMCWHLASEGLLPLLRHFELDDTRLSPNGYIEVVHAPRRAAAGPVLPPLPPLPPPPSAEAGSSACLPVEPEEALLEGGDEVDFRGWVDAAGCFRTACVYAAVAAPADAE